MDRTKDVPEWALKRAAELTRELCGYDIAPQQSHYGTAFARYIAEHEEAPNPSGALSEIIERRYQWMNAGPFIIADLADRGFTIVPTKDGRHD